MFELALFLLSITSEDLNLFHITGRRSLMDEYYHQCSFLKEDLLEQRHYNLFQYAKYVDSKFDDYAIVEFGVASCRTAKVILAAGKHDYYGFDSFQGLPEPVAEDGGHAKEGMFRFTMQYARVQLGQAEDGIFLIPGWIPESFEGAQVPDNVGLVHCDLDLFEPTIDSIKYILPKMFSGAILIIDDYGNPLFPGVFKAVLKLQQEGVLGYVIHLPANQGVYIK